MTEADQNLALAKWDGWHTIQPNPLYTQSRSYHMSDFAGFRSGDNSALCGIPNYTRDLNAVRELLLKLEVGNDGSEADSYQQALWIIVNPGIGFGAKQVLDVAFMQKLLTATAAQHCEAVLKALELRTD